MLPLQKRCPLKGPVSLIVTQGAGSSPFNSYPLIRSTCRRAGGYTNNERQPHAGSSEAAALDLEQGAVFIQSRHSVNLEGKTKTEYTK